MANHVCKSNGSRDSSILLIVTSMVGVSRLEARIYMSSDNLLLLVVMLPVPPSLPQQPSSC